MLITQTALWKSIFVGYNLIINACSCGGQRIPGNQGCDKLHKT